jgi:hypothetical protein
VRRLVIVLALPLALAFAPAASAQVTAQLSPNAAGAGAPAGAALLTNPTTCAGSWKVRLEVDYGDGPQTHDAAAPCAP